MRSPAGCGAAGMRLSVRRGRDRSARGTPHRRARAHRPPARGVRRAGRAGRLRRRLHRPARSRGQADPPPRLAAHARSDRTGGGVRRQQLPPRLLGRRRRHRLGPRRGLPGGGQGASVSPRHERDRGSDRRRCGAGDRPSRRRLLPPAIRRGGGRRGARGPPRDRRGRVHRLARGRASALRPCRGPSQPDPRLRRNEQHQPAGRDRRRP